MTASYARPEHDYYATPRWVSFAGLNAWTQDLKCRGRTNIRSILEPAAAAGELLPTIRAFFPEATIDARDLQPRADCVQQCDFWLDEPEGRYDLIITNPPFKDAERFVTTALAKVRPMGHVFMLLPTGFLASHERRGFRRECGLPQVIYLLDTRPSYRGTGTDSRDHAWMWWRRGQRCDRSELVVI